MRRVFSRGLNFHGQCGLGRDIRHSIEKFSEVDAYFPIKNVHGGLAQSIALHEGFTIILLIIKNLFIYKVIKL